MGGCSYGNGMWLMEIPTPYTARKLPSQHWVSDHVTHGLFQTERGGSNLWRSTARMEIHNDPSNAKSDPNTVLNIKDLKHVLGQAKAMHELRLELLEKYGPDNVE